MGLERWRGLGGGGWRGGEEITKLRRGHLRTELVLVTAHAFRPYQVPRIFRSFNSRNAFGQERRQRGRGEDEGGRWGVAGWVGGAGGGEK